MHMSNMVCPSSLFIVITIIFCFSAISCADKIGDSSGKRNGLIQEAMKSFLGVKDSLEDQIQPKKLPEPPRYMLDLYDSYKAGQTPTQGNTVRSILSIKGKVKGVEMLVFNLTGIQPDEKILEGRLHLFRRRRTRVHKRRETAQYRLRIMDLRSPNNPRVIEMRNKQGWQSYDVTDMVIKCRSTKHDGDYLFGVSTENQRLSGKYRATAFKKVLRLSSQPFLIIFSEDRNNGTNARDQTNNDTLSVIEDLLKQVRNDTGQRNFTLTAKDILTERKKRSTFTNIDDYSSFISTSNVYHSHMDNVNSLGMNKGRRIKGQSNPVNVNVTPRRTNISEFLGEDNGDLAESKMANLLKNRQRRSLTSNDVPYDTENSLKLSEKEKVLEKYSRKIDPNIIPLPSSMEDPNVLKYRRRKRKRKNRKMPHPSRHMKQNNEKACQRKKLGVDFASIGWSDSVIAPAYFESFYCVGNCSFPSIRNGRPSNHATIQSIVHAMNRELHVPAPCCVPSSTSSLTLLYLDENKNVVLKKYPDMIVESCACR